jgi:FAD/FMN-containing dehydrogenase
MARFRDIILNEEEGTVEIGAGLTWTEVYSYLVPRGLNVVGGSHRRRRRRRFLPLAEVGILPACRALLNVIPVAGYSWKTNQYGLTIDTVTAFELVLPNGYVITGHREGRRSLVRTQGTSK